MPAAFSEDAGPAVGNGGSGAEPTISQPRAGTPAGIPAITDRREAVAAAAQLRAMIAGLNAVVWERDPQTLRTRFVNDRAAELLGYPTERWLADAGLTERILCPDDREAVLARLRRAIAADTDFTMSYRARSADGRWLWLQHLGHVARDEDDRPVALHAVIFDVTEARRREQASALLAAAGRALAADGPVEGRLGAVAGLALGLLGERAVVWLAGDDNRYSMVAAAPAELAAQVRGLPAVRAPDELRPLIAAGRPFTTDPPTEEMRREATGGDPALEELAAADPQPRRQLVVPLHHGGERVGLLSFFTADLDRRYDEADLTLADDLGQRMAAMVATERAAARQRQLHELTAALSAAGTVAEAAAGLADGLRRVLGASVAAVCTLAPDGLLHTVEARGYPPEREAGYAAMRLSAAFPIPEAARTGRPVWVGDRAALLSRYPGIERHLREATQASAALPLRAAGRVIGALGLAFTTPRRFDPGERTFLQAVADQVAIAVERAALADVRREMAEVLQRALLPAVPALSGVEAVARYLPGGDAVDVGGDWYDIIERRPGCVVFVVGDVSGHGLPAATTMAALRFALRGFVSEGHELPALLTLLRGLLDVDVDHHFATVLLGELDVPARRLRLLSAGHPPPLLLAGASADLLAVPPAPPVGVTDPAPPPVTEIRLPKTGTLLAFSDGLVERPGEVLDTGLDRLRAAAVGAGSRPVPVMLDDVLAALTADGGRRDDTVILGLRWTA